ncbi:MAG TPA: ATP-binding cassette domain-containing protein [Planctomycetaceae bacterium]|nr:ATP-binding cassette domain-containing protein [Planctomycetaceae bacterium]
MADKNDARSAAGSNGAMVEARGLSKFYGPFAATKHVSFSVPRGQVAAFLGPNGAGKSTTMKLLTGFLAPTEGEAYIGGYNVETHRLEAARLVGYLPENGPLYNEMTPAGLLRYLGQARGLSGQTVIARLQYVVEKCDLSSVLHKPIGKLSHGFRQRVGMAQALLHDPDVLILDEPTSGLDPNQVHEVRQLIRSLGQTKTILLSTHILQEVRAVCSRVILINEGRVIFDGPVEEMGAEGKDMEERFRELTTA